MKRYKLIFYIAFGTIQSERPPMSGTETTGSELWDIKGETNHGRVQTYCH